MLPAPSRHGRPVTPAGSRRGTTQYRLADRLLLAAVAVIVLMAGLSNMGGTYAMWRDQADADAGTVSSGTASLAADWTPDHDEDCWYDLLPGESVQQSLTLTNAGDVPMELSATVPHATAGLEIRAAVGTDERPLPTRALGASGQPLTAAGAPGAPVVLDTRESIDVTVEITATSDLSPGEQAYFEVLVEGRQTR